MKKNLANGFALLAALAAIAATAPNSSAQNLAPGEYIVGPEQVISDTVVGSDKSGSDSDNAGSDSFVGDMSAGDASGSGGNCSSGDCASGSASGGHKHLGGGRLAGLLGGVLGHGAHAGDIGNIERGYGQPDLFYNYYTSGQANRANAQMYLSPQPIPPNVGHTFFTYQPFYPEEMLYWHKNKFHNYYDNGRGMNRTRAVYYAPPIRQAASNLYWNKLRLPR